MEPELEDFVLTEVAISKNYTEGSYFQVVQQSLSAGALEYFSEVDMLISREGGIFDPPAGQILTNFERSSTSASEVFGYFYLTETDTIRVFVNPDNLNVGATVCECKRGFFDICDDCPNSLSGTVIKPDWWID